MSHYDLTQLLKKWEIATLTSEQTIGQVLLHLQSLSNRVGDIEKKLEQLRRKAPNIVELPLATQPTATAEDLPMAAESVSIVQETPAAESNPFSPEPLATAVSINEQHLTVNFSDGRILSVPLIWYPRLSHSTAAEQKNWQLRDQGQTVEWLDLEQKIEIEGLLNGRRSEESEQSFNQWLTARKTV